MTVTTTLDRKYYPGDGANKNFPFNFKFFDNSQIYVYLIAPDGTITPKLLTVDYSLTGAMAAGGGTVTMVVAPPLNYTLLVQRKLPLTQPTSVRNQGAFFPGIHEDAFDRLTMLIQELSGRVGRVLEFPAADPDGISTILPTYIARAGRVLAFDVSGNPIVSNFTLEQIEQQPALAEAAAAAAAASAAAALDSQNASSSSASSASDSAVLAQKWAENPEDTPVTAGLFSAHHWANKASATVLGTQRQIIPVTATVSANALTLGLPKTPLTFRSASLNSGTVNIRDLPANLSLIVPAGATLGTANGVLGRIMILAIDSAGTVELAAVNAAGGVNLDEAGLISTTAITSGSNSASVIYSTTARSNVPYRVVGFQESTQAAAGTWATAPSRIQGAGGQAIATNSIGNGQVWADLTGSRAYATNYINITGRAIEVSVYGTGSANGTISLLCNGLTIDVYQFYVASAGGTVKGIIPAGATYRVDYAGSGFGLVRWTELR